MTSFLKQRLVYIVLFETKIIKVTILFVSLVSKLEKKGRKTDLFTQQLLEVIKS